MFASYVVLKTRLVTQESKSTLHLLMTLKILCFLGIFKFRLRNLFGIWIRGILCTFSCLTLPFCSDNPFINSNMHLMCIFPCNEVSF
jgi:hypothetical protein